MINIVRQGDTDQYDVMAYAADTLADIDALPTDVAMGSTCVVIENSSVYMLGSDKAWHEL